MKKVEESRPTAQRTGCLGWIFGIGSLLIRISEKLDKKTLQTEAIKTAPPHQAITGVDLKYTHPELVPSQPEYQEQHGGKAPRAYTGQDLRGG